MKSSDAELLAKLTELARDLEFPVSCSSHPIHPFIWEIEVQGELSIENLLKTETPNFLGYSEGGKIIRTGDLEEYRTYALYKLTVMCLNEIRLFQALKDELQINSDACGERSYR